MNIEGNVLKKFIMFSEQFSDNNMKTSIISSLAGSVNTVIISLSDWIIVLAGAWLIITDKLSIGSYVAFNGYLGKFLNSIQSIISLNLTIQRTVVSMERIYYFFDTESEKYGQPLNDIIQSGQIRVNNLSFNYNKASQETLKNISINIPSNSISAIVGFNGCGKSTLFNLLVRLYEHKKGSILFDDKPIEEMSLIDLRHNIAYIHQEPFLFNTSIKNNLLLVQPEATIEEIKEACCKAYIDEFICNLPEKYETLIGYGGIKLSGGQKQRLSIARAILKKPKILLLDEITSDLDGESEYFIMKCINDLSKEHTILMIAHRLTSIVNLPKIYVINDGEIVDEGTHNELLERCEVYSRLFKNQAAS